MKRNLFSVSYLVSLLNRTAFTPEHYDNHRSSRAFILHLIKRYGFIECNDVRKFLTFCCSDHICKAEATYIEDKLGTCLLNHDNGSKYFDELKAAYEVVTAISRGP